MQALFSGQRMEKRGLSSQIKSLSLSCSDKERGLILKSNDKGRRSEANDGEAYALVYLGRLFPGSRMPLCFYPFYGP